MSATTWCIIILLAQIRYSSLTYRMAGNFQLNQSWVGMAYPKFRGENFRRWLSNREIHEHFEIHPRKISTIR